MYIGDLAALVQKIGRDKDGNATIGEVQFAAGTFFRDGAKHLEKLEKGKVYKASLIAKEHNDKFEISSDRAIFAPQKDYAFPMTFDEYYKEKVATEDINILLSDLDISKSDNPTDFRTITVTAFDCDVAQREDGSEYGWYDFFDDSIMGSNVRMFFHPKDVEYAQGSILTVGLKVDISQKTNEPIITAYFIIPTGIAAKRTITVKPV